MLPARMRIPDLRQQQQQLLSLCSCSRRAEALPFISAFGVLPASLAFFVYHDALVSRLDSRHVFYWSLLPLAAFFALFAVVLLPNVATLHPLGAAEQWAARLPASVGCLVRAVANWTYSAFFIAGEMWGSVAISLLFWSLADDLCSVDEAKDVYPKLGILANIGLIGAGWLTRFVNDRLARGNEVLALQILTAAVLGMTGLMCGVKAALDAHVAPHVARQEGRRRSSKKQQQQGGSAGAAGGDDKETRKQGALAVIRASPRIRDLTLLVMGYGVTHKLLGFVWKAQMRLSYPSTAAYSSIMADIAAWTGAATIALMLSSKCFFSVLGWRGAALATPLVCMASGTLFLAGSFFPAGSLPAGSPWAALLALAPAAGIVAQVFGRASKYSLFDPSKEMVFITMDKHEKETGKAAVDILGNQVGKTGGAWLMQGALLVCGSMAAALPFTALAYGGVCAVWLRATLSLADTMEGEEQEKTVLASIDSTPMLEPPAPGGLRLRLPEGGAAGVAALSAAEAQDIKESMQSQFD